MPKFFISSENIINNRISISDADYTHLTKVLRHKKGDVILVCDGINNYSCKISSIIDGVLIADIQEQTPFNTEPNVNVILFQALCKGSKMDIIIQKAVELGVYEITPFISERCVSRPSDAENKISRWNKIAMEASKQCGRGYIPKVTPLLRFDEIIKRSANTALFYEKENTLSFREYLTTIYSNPNIIIGPEGGFDESEVNLAEKHGIHSVTLGKRILRAETAGACALSVIMYHTGNLD